MEDFEAWISSAGSNSSTKCASNTAWEKKKLSESPLSAIIVAINVSVNWILLNPCKQLTLLDVCGPLGQVSIMLLWLAILQLGNYCLTRICQCVFNFLWLCPKNTSIFILLYYSPLVTFWFQTHQLLCFGPSSFCTCYAGLIRRDNYDL